MKENIAKRVALLREVMARERIDAFVFPSTDAHGSEYVADHWKGREWISGFSGSAGTAVITRHSAALWTDSRYFIAAAQQLEGTEYRLMRQRMPGTPTIAEWLGIELADTDSPTVALDGSVNAYADVEALTADLRQHGGITLRINFDPLALIWPDRPPLPARPVVVQPLEYAGETVADKVVRIRRALRGGHADGMLVSALDDIAWTLNLRGDDIPCNPVFIAYLLIDSRHVTLFTDGAHLDDGVRSYLAQENIGVRGYGDIDGALRDYFEYSILIDPQQTNALLPTRVPRRTRIVYAPSPIPVMKAVKNAAEIAGFRAAMVRDGVAMVRFLRWLYPAVQAGGVTELTIVHRLADLRAQYPEFRGVSFDIIAAYQEHGAIVHYEPTEATDMPLRPEGLLLLDSGAQYVDGTTDLTRTLALGPVTDEQRRVYTLVLRSHIRLEMARFPRGACGTQIDAIAREPLWSHGYNFMHGTGHGVGSHLCVHEGPQQIRMEYCPTPLSPGMTITDEPGVYLERRFGVRLENMLLVAEGARTECGDFLQMEAFTLCPFDTAPIIPAMMMHDEIDWLNHYHATVYERLAPSLSPDERAWLRQATAPLQA